MRRMKSSAVLFFGLVMLPGLVWAQQGNVMAKLGYPQTIIYNAKIATVDDSSFTAQVGTIAQAMAIRDGKILATGTNAEIQALAGPQTKQIDLKGRTVLPNFSMTHEHPTDWAFQEPRALTHALAKEKLIVHKWLPNLPPKEQLARFEPMLKEAIAESKPGQWILLSFNWGPTYQWAKEMGVLYGQSIKREYVDPLTPNNPVKIKNGFITSVVNQLGMDELKKVHPTLDVIGEREKEGYGFNRPVEPNVMFRGRTDLLAEVLKSELELWASYGVTTFGSSPYASGNYQALSYLDAKGEMPARFGWGYTGPDFSMETLRYMAGSLGHGTDHLWLVGAWGGAGSDCMTIQPRPEWEQLKKDWTYGSGDFNRCSFEPGSPGRENVERIIESGMRVATMHTGGDKDIDYYMDAIEEGSKKGNLSKDYIRSMRHAFDHTSGAPRPQQIPRMKDLGMIVSQINTVLWEPQRGATLTAAKYGLEYTSWVTPRKLVTDNQIPNGFEMDRPMPWLTFFLVLKGINRYNDYDKRVYGPDQRTDRIIQLKALTRWGAYYLLREDKLGTLEPGKLADFIVLDKDFLTIPEDQIPTIQVLMTTVGGKVVHLGSALAREIGMQPVGATTWTEKMPEGWGPPPSVPCGHTCANQQ
ncbi:MAG: amidohydrolase family protein [Acidobacteria bacterium]|nr:amidohydrolase family protein [Acidobacteriota bacterium]